MIKYNKEKDKFQEVRYAELLTDKKLFAETIKNIYKDIGDDPEWADRSVVIMMCLLLKEIGYKEGIKIFEKNRDWKPLL